MTNHPESLLDRFAGWFFISFGQTSSIEFSNTILRLYQKKLTQKMHKVKVNV